MQIQSLPTGQPITAKSVVLQIQCCSDKDRQHEDDLNVQQLKDLARLMKSELRNISLTIGTMVRYNFFNRNLTLKVVGWSNIRTSDNGTTLEESFQELNLNKNKMEDIFKVTPSTVIEIQGYGNENALPVTKEDDISNRITKQDIGGLYKQLEIIEEALDFALNLRVIPKGKCVCCKKVHGYQIMVFIIILII